MSPTENPIVKALTAGTTADEDCALGSAVRLHLLGQLEGHPMRNALAELSALLHDSAYIKGGCRHDSGEFVRCDVDDSLIDGEPSAMPCGALVHPDCAGDHRGYCWVCDDGAEVLDAAELDVSRRILFVMGRSYLEGGYIASGCMRPGNIEQEVGGDEGAVQAAIKLLVGRNQIRVRGCSDFVYELAPVERLKLIERYGLAGKWGERPGGEVVTVRYEAAQQAATRAGRAEAA